MGYRAETKWTAGPQRSCDFHDEDVFGLIGDESVFNHKFHAAFQDYQRKLLRKNWRFLGQGRHRIVFATPSRDKVIKISRVPMGVKANLLEVFWGERGEVFRRPFGQETFEIPIPKVYGHTRVGPLSVMCVEFVERTDRGFALAKQPGGSWIHAVDCDGSPQVGYTQSGRLVAFDWCPF